MTTVQYTRTAGRRLTYDISANESGRYTVRLEGRELMRGYDRLSAQGLRCSPNKRKAVGAIHEAKLAIERLSEMNEI
jgi:hypothetical protein